MRRTTNLQIYSDVFSFKRRPKYHFGVLLKLLYLDFELPRAELRPAYYDQW